MGLINLQWGLNYRTCLSILEFEFHCGVLLLKYVVLNQGCCGSSQHNLPDGMLRLDANAALDQSYLFSITLVNMTYKSRDQYRSSIHSWDSGLWQALYVPPFFYYYSWRFFLVLFRAVLKTFNKRCPLAYTPDQFLV